MCRVLGIAYGDTPEEAPVERIVMQMYAALESGGPDAWGYFRYDGEDIWTHKEPGSVLHPRARRRLYHHLHGQNTKWFVGHVRLQTHGSWHDNLNNHPIQHGNIVGVHNGIIRNYQDVLDITGREDDRAEVDSEAIFAAINKWGHIPGLRKLLGTMVTVYADIRKPHLLHIARSNNRQLHLGFTKNGNLAFATDRIALRMLELIGVEYEGFSVVRKNRHLVIRDGKIIKRTTYQNEPEQQKVPVAVQSLSAWENSLSMLGMNDW